MCTFLTTINYNKCSVICTTGSLFFKMNCTCMCVIAKELVSRKQQFLLHKEYYTVLCCDLATCIYLLKCRLTKDFG